MTVLTPADFDEPLCIDGSMGRRVFIKGVGLVSVSLITGILGGCDKILEEIRNRPIRRRLRTGSPEVGADIETYRQAVAAMKALPASDGRSWSAQAGIHGTVSGGFRFCQHGTDHFFDWHRAYLLFFEKICQKLTGNSKFGLPYWNWNQNVDIHPAFLDTSSTLFLARTRNSMAGSFSITNAALDPIIADTNFFTFRPQLEGTPHNNVHTFIGRTMASGGSALDPLFWVHHCMVDYCWAKWNIELNNNNPNDKAWVSFENGPFVTADGAPATMIGGLTVLAPLLTYQYESSPIGSSPAVAAITTKSAFDRLEQRLRRGADIRLDVKKRIRLAEKAQVRVGRTFSQSTGARAREVMGMITSDWMNDRAFASVQFASAPQNTDFTVRVFVNLPEANTDTSMTDPHFAGSFTFFGAEHEGTKHQTDFLVNVTNALKNLRKAGQLDENTPISVQLVPAPFELKTELVGASLDLTGVDLIVTPVIVNAMRE